MKKAQGRPSPSVSQGAGESESMSADKSSSATQRLELESRLAVLDEKIAQKEQEIKDIESGKLDSEIPRLYAEVFNEKEDETIVPKKEEEDKKEEEEQENEQEQEEKNKEQEKEEDEESVKEKVVEVKSEPKEAKETEKDKEKKKEKKRKDDASDEDEDKDKAKKEKSPLKVSVKVEPEEAPTETKDYGSNDKSDKEDESKDAVEEEPKVKAEKVEVKKEDVKPPAKPPAQHRGRPRLNKTAPPASTPPGAEGLTQAEIDQRIAGLNAMKKNMEEIIRLALKKDSVFFDHAVTKEEAPDYCDTIKHRIDLSFLQRRIQRGRYQWPACKSQAEAGALFSRDLMLMFANAFIFNAPGSEICEVAESLKMSCIKHLKEYNMWPLVVEQAPKTQAKGGANESLKRASEEKSQGSEAAESDDNEGPAEEVDAPAPATKRRKKSHR